jgi:hypothetical protein
MHHTPSTKSPLFLSHKKCSEMSRCGVRSLGSGEFVVQCRPMAFLLAPGGDTQILLDLQVLRLSIYMSICINSSPSFAATRGSGPESPIKGKLLMKVSRPLVTGSCGKYPSSRSFDEKSEFLLSSFREV